MSKLDVVSCNENDALLLVSEETLLRWNPCERPHKSGWCNCGGMTRAQPIENMNTYKDIFLKGNIIGFKILNSD